MANLGALVLVNSKGEGILQTKKGDAVDLKTKRWYDWLERNSSFRFESGIDGKNSFTARKHEREAGDFWYAYRKVAGKLKNSYLGKSDRLTVERLLEVADKLVNSPETVTAQSTSGQSTECITEQLGNEPSLSTDCITTEVMQKKAIAELTQENEQLQSLLKELQEQVDYLKAETDKLWVDRQQRREMLKQLLERVNAKQKGYQSNSFAQGLKDLRDLV